MLKSISLLICLSIFTLSLKAQDTTQFRLVKLKKTADYALAEPKIKNISEYLLNTPIKKDEMNRLDATQFLLKWMEGTPDHTYSFHSRISQITKDNIDLMGVYLAAMVKFSLEYKDESADLKVLQLNTLKTLLTYVANPENGVKSNTELKKMKELASKGLLEKYIK
ncbi:MAG: hypothetical protein V4687_15155 [Bacteroidota bacterium]